MATKKKTSGKNRKIYSPKNEKKDYAFQKPSALKIVLILFVIVFISIVAAGIFRAYQSKADFKVPTDAQIALAKTAALNDLAQRGDLPLNYSLKVSDKVHSSPSGSATAHDIIEVSITGTTPAVGSSSAQSVRHMYIIDANSGEILVYSMTEFHEGMPLPKGDDSRFPGGPDGMRGTGNAFWNMFGR